MRFELIKGGLADLVHGRKPGTTAQRLTLAITCNDMFVDIFVSAYEQEFCRWLESDAPPTYYMEAPNLISHIAFIEQELRAGRIRIDSVVKRACMRIGIQANHAAINAFVRAQNLDGTEFAEGITNAYHDVLNPED